MAHEDANSSFRPKTNTEEAFDLLWLISQFRVFSDSSNRKCLQASSSSYCVSNPFHSEPKLLSSRLGVPTPPINHETFPNHANPGDKQVGSNTC